MNDTLKTRILTPDKIFLIGLLMVSLVMAYLVVSIKFTFKLSKPIELPYSGLAVSIPKGKGWQSEFKWKYQNNFFVLTSVFDTGTGGLNAALYCRYFLTSRPDFDPNTQFKDDALKLDSQIALSGKINTAAGSLNWVQLKRKNMDFGVYLGSIILPCDRRLDIELRYAVNEAAPAAKVFTGIAEKIKFKETKLLTGGKEVVDSIKRAGLAALLNKQNPQAFFFIKDLDENIIGFTTDFFIDRGKDFELNVQTADMLYMKERFPQEQVSFFEGNNDLSRFKWKTELNTPLESRGNEVAADKSEITSVSKTPLGNEIQNYPPGNSIPGIFLDIVMTQMLAADLNEIVVDVLDNSGKIIPALITKVPEESVLAGKTKNRNTLNVKLLDQRGLSERIVFDKQNQVLYRLLQHDNIAFERTDAQEIIKLFPEHANYIQQRNKLLQDNQPKP